MKQLRRGAIRIEAKLDLHGHNVEEAIARLSHFLESARHRGCATVLIITGKGLNSPAGRPVLFGEVDRWLRGHGRALVAEFSIAPRSLGGNGAFVVFLRK